MPSPEYLAMDKRFFTANSGDKPSDEQVRSSRILRYDVVALAEKIEQLVPSGRDKSLALTHLEDVLMRANRGIFAPKEGS